MKNSAVVTPEYVRYLRNKSCLNQRDFWARIGVTQTGGSRYERGHKLSKQIQLLIQLVYGDEVEAKATFVELRKIRETSWDKKSLAAPS